MNGKSLKAQYRDCYQLERLIQQSYALRDYSSVLELEYERQSYPQKVRIATFLNFFHCQSANGGMEQWRDKYRQKAGLE